MRLEKQREKHEEQFYTKKQELKYLVYLFPGSFTYFEDYEEAKEYADNIGGEIEVIKK